MNRPALSAFTADPPDSAALSQSPSLASALTSPTAGAGSGAATGTPAPGASSKPTYAKRGKITIVACVPCRKRKTKCDGKRPSCSQCTARDGACSYDMSDDQRKLTYLRDNVEQLQVKTHSLQSLLYTVQNASDGEAAEIFRRLRTGTDIHVVAEQVQAGQLLFGVGGREPEQIPQRSERHQVVRTHQLDQLTTLMSDLDDNSLVDLLRRVRNREDLSNMFEEARAEKFLGQSFMQSSIGPSSGVEGEFTGPDHIFGMMRTADVNGVSKQSTSGGFNEAQIHRSWTTVTQDSKLIDHLLKLYFTWQHSFFQNFPENLFRSDMAAGRTKFCSEMLVNAICAAGCLLASSENIRSMVPLFFDEAKSHMENIDVPDVATTAALYLMSYVEGTRGRLSSLWMLSGRSVSMAIDLGLHLRQMYPTDQRTSEDAEKQANEFTARCHAFWGAFHVDQTTSFTLGRLALFNANGVTTELPPLNDKEDEEPWEAYEMALPKRPSARASTFHHCAKLSLIVNSTLMMFNAPTVSLSGAALLDQYQKYKEWFEQLPGNISSTYNAPPHVICIHMYYHTALLSLFRPFLKATIAGSSIVPREICRNAANMISDLWHQHRALYGLSGIYMFQVHCLLTACTIHIINVPTISSTRYFTHACNTFQDLLSRNDWARSCLGILRGLAEKWNLILPLEAEEALYRDVGGSRGGDQEGTQGSNEQQTELRPPQNPQITTKVSGQFPHHPNTNLLGPTSPQTHPSQLQQNTSQSSSSKSAQGQRSQPGQSQQSAAESAQVPTKRSSGSNQQPESPSTVGAPKRQRVVPSARQALQEQSTEIIEPNAALGAVARSVAPQARMSSRTQTQQRSAQSASNFLYSPLANQPPPLLTPVNAGSGVTTRASQAAARKAATAPQQQTGKSSRPPSETSTAQSGEQEQQQEQGVDVDGLSFRDDWRDPFMGYPTLD